MSAAERLQKLDTALPTDSAYLIAENCGREILALRDCLPQLIAVVEDAEYWATEVFEDGSPMFPAAIARLNALSAKLEERS